MKLKEELFLTPLGLVGFTGMQDPVMHDDYLLQCIADSAEQLRRRRKYEKDNLDPITV